MYEVLMSGGSGSPDAPKLPFHAFSQLQADEIAAAKLLIEQQWPQGTSIHYKVLTLMEPDKDAALEYLAAEHANTTLPSLERRASLNYYIRNTVCIVGVGRLLTVAEQISRSNCQSNHLQSRKECSIGPERSRTWRWK
jgi:Cu2+-containing amine oxidase